MMLSGLRYSFAYAQTYAKLTPNLRQLTPRHGLTSADLLLKVSVQVFLLFSIAMILHSKGLFGSEFRGGAGQGWPWASGWISRPMLTPNLRQAYAKLTPRAPPHNAKLGLIHLQNVVHMQAQLTPKLTPYLRQTYASLRRTWLIS